MVINVIIGAIIIFIVNNLKDVNYLSMLIDNAHSGNSRGQIVLGRLVGGAIVIGGSLVASYFFKLLFDEAWQILTALFLVYFAIFQAFGRSNMELKQEATALRVEFETNTHSNIVWPIAKNMVMRSLERYVTYFAFMSMLDLKQSILVLFVLELATGLLAGYIHHRRNIGRRLVVSHQVIRWVVPIMYLILAFGLFRSQDFGVLLAFG